jgi:hypothetical protein
VWKRVRISTVALRVVEGDEKGIRCLGGITGPPVTGDINIETWFSRLGIARKADDIALKNLIVAKSKEVKTGCKSGRSSKEGCGSKRAVFPMMMMMMMI